MTNRNEVWIQRLEGPPGLIVRIICPVCGLSERVHRLPTDPDRATACVVCCKACADSRIRVAEVTTSSHADQRYRHPIQRYTRDIPFRQLVDRLRRDIEVWGKGEVGAALATAIKISDAMNAGVQWRARLTESEEETEPA